MTMRTIRFIILLLIFPLSIFSQSDFDVKIYNTDSELIEYGSTYKEGFVVVEYTPGTDGMYLSLGADWADYSGPFGMIVENLYLPNISEVGAERFSISTSFNLNSIAKTTQGIEGTEDYVYPTVLVIYVHLLRSIGYYPLDPSTWLTTLEVAVLTYAVFAYNLIITTPVGINDSPGTVPPDQPVGDPVTTRVGPRKIRGVDLDNSSNPGVDGGYAGDLNACVPAAHSQSMSWLEDEFDEISFPANMQSTRQKLVELSKKMNRAKEKGVVPENTIKGKLDFIESQNLPIDVKFQSVWESTNISSTSGKSIAKNFNRASNPWPDWEFIKQMMASGEDVEIDYLWYKESDSSWNGHAVTVSGLEEFQSGKRNISITHDRDQMNADNADRKWLTTETLTVSTSENSNGNDVITMQRNGSTKKLWIQNVYAESPRPSEGEATATFLNEFFNMSGNSSNIKQNVISAENEFIEIGLDESVTNLADYSIHLYEGTNGTVYQTLTLDQLTLGTKTGNYQTYVYTFEGNQLQEEPAGIALSYTGTVVEGQFFSYGGTFTATAGDATGMTSIDMGNFVGGQSFALQGAGTNYTDFSWDYSSNPSPGAFNDRQFLTSSVPGTPTLQTPTDGSTEQETTLTLSWNEPQYASTYTLEVATDQQFSNIVFNESSIAATSKEVSALNSGILYYWRVKAVNSNGESPYSNVWSFTTKSTDPIVSDIPDQTIAEGSSFATIQLDNFVVDPDNPDSEITWSYSGNAALTVSIDGSRIATITTPNEDWNGSETITFTATDPGSASDSDQATFTVTPVNDSPVVSDIPNQTINEGSSFTTIQLDNFVTDADNLDSEITWSYSGNTALTVSIDGSRIATITTPNSDWFGSETITFTATDPGNDSDSDQATFVVLEVNNPPVVGDIPSQTINEGGSFAAINLDDFVTDADNPDSEITWSYSGNTELIVAIDGSRVATITAPNQDWNGSETITFTATDPTNQSDSDDAAFTINSVDDTPVVSDIPDQTVTEGGSFASINLDDFVTDADNLDSEITWSYSGNTELIVAIDGSRVATITAPNQDWNGSETITFTATDPTNQSDSDDAVFTVNSVDDNPVVADIPDQTIAEGSNFTTIQLDNFVTDADNPDSEITWSYSGNTELIIAIDGNRVATITAPNQDWFGSETINFTATDPSSLSDNDNAIFTITPVNDAPVIEGLPNSITISIDSTVVISLWDYVSDVEDFDNELIYEFTITGGNNLFVSFNTDTGEFTVSANTNYSGEETLTIKVTDLEGAFAESSITVQVEEVTGVYEYLSEEIPDEFVLLQNYPNPYNPTTNIRFGLPENSDVQLIIYNSLGELVKELVNQNMNSGFYEITWDASNLPSGIYFIRIGAYGLDSKKNFTQVKKALLLK
ncbi:MAG: tandem-95 repeat protein [Melioribacteraceae bacterium]|nr:tandem-95 repeat protein [Melioribacteraceae bacterium]